MSMGRRQKRQSPLWIAHDELAPSPGHRYYETLNELLREAAFDQHAEALCAPYYEAAHVPGRKSVAHGVYFRMHLVGFFEGIESERGLEWRFADSLSLRQFLGLALTQRVPDHSTLSRTRQRLRLDVHQAVFALVLGIVESKGLLKGRVLGVDSTYRRADASMKAIVRRDTNESDLECVTRLAEEAGVPPPRLRTPGGWTESGQGRRPPTASGSRAPTTTPGSPRGRTAARAWPTSRSTWWIWRPAPLSRR